MPWPSLRDFRWRSAPLPTWLLRASLVGGRTPTGLDRRSRIQINAKNVRVERVTIRECKETAFQSTAGQESAARAREPMPRSILDVLDRSKEEPNGSAPHAPQDWLVSRHLAQTPPTWRRKLWINRCPGRPGSNFNSTWICEACARYRDRLKTIRHILRRSPNQDHRNKRSSPPPAPQARLREVFRAKYE